MRQTSRLVLLVVAMAFLSIAKVNAQHMHKYYLNFWGAGGYANLLHDRVISEEERLVKPLGGVGGLVGLGFEYHYRRFIVSLGAEFDYKLSSHKFKPFITQVGTIVDDAGNAITFQDMLNLPDGSKPKIKDGTGMKDTEGEQFAMEYDFAAYKDVYSIGYLNVPLKFGAKYPSGMYFLLGGKFGINMLGSARTKAKYTTRGLYPTYMDPLQDMGQHYYDDFKSGGSNPVKLDFNVVASLEVGKIMFFNKRKTRWHYRLAGFVDYSVGAYFGMNPLPTEGKNVLTNVVSNGDFIGVEGVNVANPDLTQISIVKSNSVLTSKEALNKKLNPLMVGVKFTLLFDLGNKEPCNCIEDWSSPWQKKNRIR